MKWYKRKEKILINLKEEFQIKIPNPTDQLDEYFPLDEKCENNKHLERTNTGFHIVWLCSECCCLCMRSNVLCVWLWMLSEHVNALVYMYKNWAKVAARYLRTMQQYAQMKADHLKLYIVAGSYNNVGVSKSFSVCNIRELFCFQKKIIVPSTTRK